MNVEKLFDILKDGEWHNIHELAGQVRTQTAKLIELSQFLSQQGIVKCDDRIDRIQIEPEWKNLLPIGT